MITEHQHSCQAFRQTSGNFVIIIIKITIIIIFSHHVFENIVVRDNDYDGIGIIYSDIYYPDHVNFLKKSLISGNKRHGISFRQLGMIISDTELRDNVRAGIYHDPKVTKLEQRELWFFLY